LRPVETKLDGSLRFGLATGFEVLEHLRKPVDELRDLAAISDRLFLTTECLPVPTPKLEDWWYYALEAGQHITLYTPRSLDILGEQLGLRRVSRAGYHLFTRDRVPRRAFQAATSAKLSHHLSRFARRATLLPADYEQLTGRPLK
jgi:hypothetical protein